MDNPADWLGLHKFTDSTNVTLPTRNDRRDFNKQRGITVVLRKNEATDARSMRPEWNQPLWPILVHQTTLMRQRMEQLK